jgi:F-type H+-transporting ATPase subunit delta
MAEPTTIARPYAEAAFRLAQEGNALPAWSQMLGLVGSVIADPRIAAALDNPRLSTADKESLVLSVLGDKLDPLGRNFVRILIEAIASPCCRRSRPCSKISGTRPRVWPRR